MIEQTQFKKSGLISDWVSLKNCSKKKKKKGRERKK